jgi:hypothetical protein
MADLPLNVTREQILAYRRRVSALETRQPPTDSSLRTAAWAGLQDSMPRAALLSIHARIEEATPQHWEHEALIQIWGPRYSTYVIHGADLPIFTVSRMPDDEKGKRRAEELADRVESYLAGRRMKDREVDEALGTGNAIRYAATTGRLVIRWEGALAPTVWSVPRPEMAVADARRELARRYLHVFGPTTPAAFAEWAGIAEKAGVTTFADLSSELIRVQTPLGNRWLLAADEEQMRDNEPSGGARLLPSGDTYYLLQGSDRELLVADPGRRGLLWTPRVWPGAVLLDGEIVGTWRRASEKVSIAPWLPLTSSQRERVEAESATLPLPGLKRAISVRWEDA